MPPRSGWGAQRLAFASTTGKVGGEAACLSSIGGWSSIHEQGFMVVYGFPLSIIRNP